MPHAASRAVVRGYRGAQTGEKASEAERSSSHAKGASNETSATVSMSTGFASTATASAARPTGFNDDVRPSSADNDDTGFGTKTINIISRANNSISEKIRPSIEHSSLNRHNAKPLLSEPLPPPTDRYWQQLEVFQANIRRTGPPSSNTESHQQRNVANEAWKSRNSTRDDWEVAKENNWRNRKPQNGN